MGLGILEDHALDQVPGTAHVLDSEEQRRRIEDASARGGRGLKYDKTGKILLVPQPGEGMGDPLVRSFRLRLHTCAHVLENQRDGNEQVEKTQPRRT